MPRSVLTDVLAYVEGERAASIRRAQAAGRYQQVSERRILLRQLGGRRIEVRDPQGGLGSVSLDVLSPSSRRQLFRETTSGLEPVAVWLNEDGMPRIPHGWQHTFVAANKRVAGAGLVELAATAHMLRHSFALRWFSVGRLLYEKRFAHLDAEEMRDFRAQFGDTWYFVMTLLGHRNVATTMNIYLEPFRDLDVELLMGTRTRCSDGSFVGGQCSRLTVWCVPTLWRRDRGLEWRSSCCVASERLSLAGSV
jgi:integrase